MEIMFEGNLLGVREYKKKDGSLGMLAVLYVRGEKSDRIEAQLNSVDMNSLSLFIKKNVRVKAEMRMYSFNGQIRVGFVLKHVEESKGF